ncbi:hypothetical protein SAMN05216553_1179 [Lentzea fradiae]|uniref:Uncharacterized protein n=1 Tax=Lentzea fradiae TaxID=200378 RepID=A0A1G8A686_9PSEU|nr:hypothetical protein [Lentzea fradiae]SDH16464.1 hypothetical protein SAMN05216553_1179 [Lentzea fradiae]
MKVRPIAEVLRADRLSLISEDAQVDDANQLSDLALLSTALVEALAAQKRGEVIGPEIDELTLRRAERRARRADGRRALHVQVLGGVA